MLSTSSKSSEIERLKSLLPNLLTRVSIAVSTETRPSLICTKNTDKDRFAIQIDLIAWEQIEPDYRNLLFWHEVARIQQHSVRSQRWETIVFASGLAMSVLEVVSQNVLLLSVYLLLAGIAGWQLYQSNRGESHLREATRADRGAILLATEFGYSLPKAYRSLHRALKILSAHSPNSYLAKDYQTRLQVLEISAIA